MDHPPPETVATYKARDILQFFEYSHLPEHLQNVSRPFSMLAYQMVNELPDNAERAEALRKLLEAKDCAVRALVWR
jgi:hypothetical protein